MATNPRSWSNKLVVGVLAFALSFLTVQFPKWLVNLTAHQQLVGHLPFELGMALFVAAPFLLLTTVGIRRPKPWVLAALLTLLVWVLASFEMALSNGGGTVFGYALLPFVFAPHLIAVWAWRVEGRPHVN